MRVYIAPPTSPIEEFCLPLLASDTTGEVRRVIDEFTARFRSHDLSTFVLYLLNDCQKDVRREAVRFAVSSMCTAKGMPLRYVWTEDDGNYYDFYNDPYFCVTAR